MNTKNHHTLSKGKITELGNLQESHQNMSDQIKDTLLSHDPYIRAEFIKFHKEHPLSLIDLQDIPDNFSENEILLLIGSFLDPNYFHDISQGKGNRTHTHLIERNGKLQASPSLLDAFQGKVKTAISKLSAKGFTHNHFLGLATKFPNDTEGNIIFNSFHDVINFIKKTPIKENKNLSPFEKTKYIYIICSILKEMVRNQDFKNNRDLVRQIQERTHQFFNEFLLGKFTSWEPIDKNHVITDETHRDYTKDKYFLINENMIQEQGIIYNKPIKIKLSYRAKTDESIKDKNMINPDTTTLSSIHDLGGIKQLIVGENITDEELLINYYIAFMAIIDYTTENHPEIKKIAPSNGDSFKTGGKYANHEEIIKTYLNSISTKGIFSDKKTPLVKDKGFLPIKKHEKSGHYIDTDLLQKLGIDDSRFLYLLNFLCKQKDEEHKKIEEKKAFKIEEKKKNTFGKIYKEVGRYDSIQEENIRYITKNYINFEKKILQIKNGENTIMGKYTISKSEGGEITITFLKETPIYWKDIQQYKEAFIKKREEYKSINNDAEKDSHKGIWTDAKFSFVAYISGIPVNIERQIGNEKDIEKIPLMDDHSIYGQAKQLLVYGRNSSGILSKNDIEHIIDNKIIKVREKNLDYKVEKGLTYREMIQKIEEDNTLLPIGGSFKEKLVYNFIHSRGLKQKHGESNIYYTTYYNNLKYHGLAP